MFNIIKSKHGGIACLLLMLASSLFVLSESDVVIANPTGGVVVAGNATIGSPSTNLLQITQTSNQAAINWQSFNIGANQTTQFFQPSSSSIALNRISASQGASQILGQLKANGQIWLVNPAGILFGAGAQVDVGGLLATTANITTKNFMAGKYDFVQSPRISGSIINNGTITAGPGGIIAFVASNAVVNNGVLKVSDAGLVTMVAPWVKNTGLIQANLSQVILASSVDEIIDFYGDQLLNFQLATAKTPSKTGVTNLGAIIANGGSVLITALAVKSVLDNVINNAGYIQADTIQEHNGEIILGNAAADVVDSGQIKAAGGTVKILGNTIALTGNASIDVSSNTPGGNGGTILIGGDAHGLGPDFNATYTFIGSDVNLYANALTTGNGGTVVVWSNLGTQFYGNIFAQGGSQSGNGGWVETSGHAYLYAAGLVNASAPNGLAGTWLLDPYDVTISTGATQNNNNTGANPIVWTPSGDPSIILNSSINTELTAGSNVSIVTTGAGTDNGNITVNAPLTKSGGAADTLTLTAGTTGPSLGVITINSLISSTSGVMNVNLVGAGNIILGAGITTNGGTFTASVASGNNSITQTAGVITTGAGGITLTVPTTGTGSIGTSSVSPLLTTSTGTLTLTAGSGGAFVANTGNLTLATPTLNTNSPLYITSSGVLTLPAGAISTGTGNLTLESLGGALTTASNVSTSTGNILLAASTALTIGANFSVSASGAGDITLNANTAGTGVNSFTMNAGSSISTGSTDTTAVTIDVNAAGGGTGAANLRNITTGAGGTLTVATNTGGNTTGGSITQSAGTSLLSGAANFSTGNGAITLTNATNNFTGAVGLFSGTIGNNLAVTNSGALTLGTITMPAGGTGLLTIISTGAITQSAGTSITKGSGVASFTAGANAITLTNTGNILGSVALSSTAGNVAVTNNGALTLGIVTASGGNLTVNTTGTGAGSGAITDAASVITVSGTSSFTAGAAAITLTGPNHFTGAITLSNSGANNVSLTNNIATILAASTVGQNLIITSSTGAITQTGALTVPGTASFTAGANAITLTNTNNSFTGAVSLSNSGANAVSLTNNGALILGTVGVGSGALTVNTTGAGAGSGAITQSGIITDAGTASFTAGAAPITLTNNNAFSGAVSFTNSGANNVQIKNLAVTLNLGSSTVGGNFTVNDSIGIAEAASAAITAGGTISINANTGGIGGNSFIMGASSSLSSGGSNSITIDVNAAAGGTGVATLANVTAGTSGAGTLTVATNTGGNTTGAGITQLASTLLSATAANFSTGNGVITLTNATNNFTGVVGLFSGTVGNNLAVTNSGALTLGTITMPAGGTGLLTIIATGAITQSGGTNITKGTGVASFTAGANPITLTSTGNSFGTLSLFNSGANNVSITNNGALVLSTVTVGSGALTVNTTGTGSGSGAITDTTSVITDLGTSSFTAGAAAITLTDTSNAFTGAVSLSNSGANNVSLTNNLVSGLVLGTVNVGSGTLTLSSSGSLHNGPITQTGAITQASGAGIASFTAGPNAITLTNAGNSFTGAVALSNSGANNVALTNNGALILGTIGVGSGTLTIDSSAGGTTSGAITQSGVTTITESGAATFTAGAAAITLTNNNAFSGTVSFPNTNGAATNVQLTNASALTLGASTIGNNLTINGATAVTISGATTTGGTIAINANTGGIGANSFTMNAGSSLAASGSTVTIDVNTMGGTGSGGAALQNISTASGGTITVSTTGATTAPTPPTNENTTGGAITQAAGLLNVGSAGTINLYVPTAASGVAIGTVGNNIITTAGTLNLSINSGGAYVSNTGAGAGSLVLNTPITAVVPPVNYPFSVISNGTLTLPSFAFSTGSNNLTLESLGGTLSTTNTLSTVAGNLTLIGSTGLTIGNILTSGTGQINLSTTSSGDVAVNAPINSTSGPLTITALGNVSLSSTINEGSGTIAINADTGAGTGNLIFNSAATITTTNASVNAVAINVNTAGGGTGGVLFNNTTTTNITTGSGGTIKISTNTGGNTTGGSITDSGTNNVLSNGTGPVTLAVPSSGSSSIGSSSNPLHTTSTGTFTLTAGSGGAFIVNTGNMILAAPTLNTNSPLYITSSGVLTLPAATISTGTSNLTLESLGGALTTAGNILTTSGNILLYSSTGMLIGTNFEVGTNSGGSPTTGTITLMVNQGATGANNFIMNTGSSIATNNATNSAVVIDINNGGTSATGGSAGIAGAGLQNISVGNGGTITIATNYNGYVPTGGAQNIYITSGQTLNAGSSGTINLYTPTTGTGSGAIGTVGTPIATIAGTLNITGRAAEAFVTNNTSNLTLNLTLGSGGAIVKNSGNINFNSLTANSGAYPLSVISTAGTLTLPASTNISTSTGLLDLESDAGTLSTTGSLATTSGAITLLGSTGLTITNPVSSTTGAITLTSTAGNILIDGSGSITGTQAVITLNGYGAVTLGDPSLFGGAISDTAVGGTGSVTINANTGAGVNNFTINSGGSINMTGSQAVTIVVNANTSSGGSGAILLNDTSGTEISTLNGNVILSTNGSSTLATSNNITGTGSITEAGANTAISTGTGNMTLYVPAGLSTNASNARIGSLTHPFLTTSTGHLALASAQIGTSIVGGVIINNTGNLNFNAFTAPASGSYRLVVTSTGTLTLPAIAISTGTGTLDLESNGGTLVTVANLSTTTGTLTLVGSTGLTINNTLTTGSGNILLNDSTSGTLNMAVGSAINSTTGNLTLNSATAISMAASAVGAASINLGSNSATTGLVAINANTGGSGANGFTMAVNAGSGNIDSITTANTSTNAIAINVNTVGGGTGSATLGNITTGSGGTLTVNTYGGSILGLTGGTKNVGTGIVNLTTSQAGAAGIGTVGAPISISAASVVNTTSGSGGTYLSNIFNTTGMVLGATNTTGVLNVTTTGPITQTAAGITISGTGTSTITAGAYPITLANSNNQLNANINANGNPFPSGPFLNDAAFAINNTIDLNNSGANNVVVVTQGILIVGNSSVGSGILSLTGGNGVGEVYGSSQSFTTAAGAAGAILNGGTGPVMFEDVAGNSFTGPVAVISTNTTTGTTGINPGTMLNIINNLIPLELGTVNGQATNVGGSLLVSATGSITENAALTVGGTMTVGSTVANTNVYLNSYDNSFGGFAFGPFSPTLNVNLADLQDVMIEATNSAASPTSFAGLTGLRNVLLDFTGGPTLSLPTISLTGTLTLEGSVAVTQQAATTITANSVAANTTSSINLGNSGNAINNLGATTSGAFTLNDTSALTITQNMTSGNNTIFLMAPSITSTQGGGIVVNAGTGAVILSANAMSLDTTGQIDASTAILTVATNGTTIGLGGGAGTLMLSQAALNTIYANNVRIGGDPSIGSTGSISTGQITIGGTVSTSATFAPGVLTLDSGSGIGIQTSGGIVATNLLIRSAGNVDLTTNATSNNITNIADTQSSGFLSITNTAATPTVTSLTDDIGTVNGITAPGGVTLATSGTGVLLTINQSITTNNAPISFIGAGITVTANTVVNSGTGSLSVNAGANTLTLNSGSELLSTGTITLTADSMVFNTSAIPSQIGEAGATVILQQSTPGTTIGIAGGIGQLQLTAAALNDIQATNVRIGNSASGNINSAAWTPDAAFATSVLTLDTAGTITELGPINLATSGSGLIIRDATNVDLSTNAGLGNVFGTIASSNVSGPIAITEAANTNLTVESLTDDIGTATGLTTTGSNGITLIEAAGTGNIAINSSITSAGNITLTAGTTIAETGTGIISGGLLTTSSVGGITLNNANMITGFNAVNAGSGDINLINNGALNITGVIQPVGNLFITNSGAITQSGGVLTVSGVSSFAAGSGNNITLNSANDFNTVSIVSGNDVSLTNIAALILGASTVSDNFIVSVNGAITQSGAVLVGNTATFSAGAGNNITLTNAGNDFVNLAITSGNNVSVTDVGPIDLAASTISGNFILVNTGGDVTQSGALLVGNTATFSVGSSNNITLTNVGNNIANLAIPSANDVSVTNAAAINLEASTISGNFTLDTSVANGAITQSGVLLINGVIKNTVLSSGSGNITLTNPNNDFSHMSILSANNASITDVNDIKFDSVNLSGNFTVNAGGTITQTDAIIANGAGTTTTLTAGGAITLGNAENDFNIVTIPSALSASLQAVNNLTLGPVSVTQNFAAEVGGNLTTTGLIQTAGGNVNLATTGAGTITIGSSGINTSTGSTVGGNITVTTANTSMLPVSITVNGVLNTSGDAGTGGVLALGGGVLLNQAPVIGAGTVTLNGANESTFFGNLNFTTATTIDLSDTDIIINGAVTSTGVGSNLSFIANSNGDGMGGVEVTNTGSVNSSGSLTLAGGNLFVSPGTSVELQAGSTLQAVGPILLLGNGGSSSNTNIIVNGTIQTTGVNQPVTVTASGTGTIDLGANITTNGGAINFNNGLVLTNDVALTTNGGSITEMHAIASNGEPLTLSVGSGTDISFTNALNDLSTVTITSANNVTLVNNDIINFGASTISGALNVTAASDITQSGALSVAGVSTFATVAGSNITLTNSNNAFSTIGITSGNNVSITNATSIVLGASAISGNLIVNANGAITQSGALLVNTAGKTATFSAGSGNNITLTNPANDFSNIGIASGNNVSITDANALNLAAITVSGNLTVNTSGAITQDGAPTLVSGLATFSSGAGNNITLGNGANNFSNIAFGSGNNVTLFNTNSVILGASTVSGALNVTAGGTISENGILTVAGTPTFTLTVGSSDLLLGSEANNFSMTPVITNNGNVRDLSLRNVSLSPSVPTLPTGLRNLTLIFDNAGINLLGTTLTGNLSVTTNGAITQTGALVVNGVGKTAIFSAGSANNITLNNASNNFTTVGITSGNNVVIDDAHALNLGASTITGSLGVTTNGAITESGALTVTGTTTLAAGVTNNITLTNAANDFSTLAITSANNANITDVNALNFGLSSVHGTLTVTTGGALTQTGAITANSLVATTQGGITLNSANAINNFNAINTVGDISLMNSANPLTITGITQTSSGNVTVINTGALINTGVIETQGGNVTLQTLSPDAAVRTLTIAAPVVTNEGSVNFNAANPTGLAMSLFINAVVNTGPGTGGIRTINGGGISITVNPIAGAGNVTVTGNGLDFSGGFLNVNGPLVLEAPRNIIIFGPITTSVGANITFIADEYGTGVGGVILENLGGIDVGSINSRGSVTLQGSSLGTVPGAVPTAGVELEAGTFITATGNISLLGTPGSNASIVLNGPVTTTGVGSAITLTSAGSGVVQLDANLTTNNGAINLNGPSVLENNIALTSNGGSVTANGTVNGAYNLTINAGSTGNITFDDAVGGTTPLGTLDILNANNVTANAAVNTNIFLQNAGSGLTSFNGSGLNNTNSATITTQQVTGQINTGSLAISVSSANLTGTVNGLSGLSGAQAVQVLNTIGVGQDFFNGFDLAFPTPPVPPTPTPTPTPTPPTPTATPPTGNQNGGNNLNYGSNTGSVNGVASSYWNNVGVNGNPGGAAGEVVVVESTNYTTGVTVANSATVVPVALASTAQSATYESSGIEGNFSNSDIGLVNGVTPNYWNSANIYTMATAINDTMNGNSGPVYPNDIIGTIAVGDPSNYTTSLTTGTFGIMPMGLLFTSTDTGIGYMHSDTGLVHGVTPSYWSSSGLYTTASTIDIILNPEPASSDAMPWLVKGMVPSYWDGVGKYTITLTPGTFAITAEVGKMVGGLPTSVLLNISENRASSLVVIYAGGLALVNQV